MAGRIVSEHGRGGYVQRGYAFHGHDFARRAYFYHGHEYNRFYHGWGYRGFYLNVYAPDCSWIPGFTDGHTTPGRRRLHLAGDGAAPWYGRYGYYFQPYPVYPSAAFWLTDYIISQDLQADYAAQRKQRKPTALQFRAADPVLSPEVKHMIAEEVKNQIGAR